MNSKGILNTSYGTYPVTMYDVDNKKPVAIFRSCRYASMYVFGEGKISMITTKSILAKRKHHTNSTGYKVIVTFRSATPDQKVQLGDKDSLILDNSFLNSEMAKKEVHKRERGRGYEVLPVGNTVKKERDEKVKELLRDGYTIEEIAGKMDMSRHTVQGIINDSKCKTVTVHSRVSDMSIDQLKEMQVIISNRIKLLEKE